MSITSLPCSLIAITADAVVERSKWKVDQQPGDTRVAESQWHWYFGISHPPMPAKATRPTLLLGAPQESMEAASVPRSSPCRPFFSFFCRSCFSIKVAPGDILNAVALQNVVMPAGTLKIGESEYDVRANGTPRTVDQIGNLPIRQVPGTTIYLRDLASVSDSFQVHTNIVRQDGRRGVLITVLKRNASTLDVVKGIRRLLPRVASISPTNLCMVPLAEQSIFVRAAVTGVIREAVIAAALTGLMILLFLGNWRSTLIIAVSIPLSILSSVIVLGFLGETINTMTLGGLALAVGILVDDATVTIENIERFLEEGHDLRNAILEGASQISVPALVSTLCICIVFLPMFFLAGVARYLFVPLAEAVVFAMLASYILSRTLVPTLAMYLLRVKTHLTNDASRTAMHKHADRRIISPLVLFQQSFNRAFEALRAKYHRALEHLLAHRRIFIPLFLLH